MHRLPHMAEVQAPTSSSMLPTCSPFFTSTTLLVRVAMAMRWSTSRTPAWLTMSNVADNEADIGFQETHNRGLLAEPCWVSGRSNELASCKHLHGNWTSAWICLGPVLWNSYDLQMCLHSTHIVGAGQHNGSPPGPLHVIYCPAHTQPSIWGALHGMHDGCPVMW